MADTTATAEQASGVSQPNPAGTETTTTPQTTETTQNAQAASAPTQTADPETERLRAELEKVRREAASHRVKLKEFETAQMSETEKQAARLAELEAENTRLAGVAKQKAIAAAITEASAKLGVKSALAVKLIDADKLDFDEAGNVKNAEGLVRGLMQEFPELAGQVLGAGNPGRTNTTTDPKAHEAALREILSGGAQNSPFSVEYARNNPIQILDAESRRAAGI